MEVKDETLELWHMLNTLFMNRQRCNADMSTESLVSLSVLI